MPAEVGQNVYMVARVRVLGGFKSNRFMGRSSPRRVRTRKLSGLLPFM